MGVGDQNVNLIIKAQDKASKAITKVGGLLDKLNGFVQRNQKVLKGAAIAGAGVVAALGLMTKGAIEQRKSQQRLAVVIENTGVNYAELADETERVIASQQAMTGISDELQRDVLSKLVVQIGNYDQALAALPAVLDASAASGKDASTVADTLGKALAGTANMAESIGVQFDKTADFSERLAVVMAKVGGTAADVADPTAKMLAQFADLSDKIGTALLPLMDRLADGLASVLEWMNNLSEGTTKVLAALGVGAGLLGALAAVLLVVPTVVAGITAIGAAMTLLSLNPIGLLVTALVATGVGIAWAFSETDEAAEKTVESMEKVGDASKATAIAIEDAADTADRSLDSFRSAQEKASRLVEGLDEAIVASLDSFGQSNDEIALAALEARGGVVDSYAKMSEEVQEQLVKQGQNVIRLLDINVAEVKATGQDIRKVVNNAWADASVSVANTVSFMVDEVNEKMGFLTQIVPDAWDEAATAAEEGAARMNAAAASIEFPFSFSALGTAPTAGLGEAVASGSVIPGTGAATGGANTLVNNGEINIILPDGATALDVLDEIGG